MRVYIVTNKSGDDCNCFNEIQEVYTHENEELDLAVLYTHYEALINQCRVDIMRVKKLIGNKSQPSHKAINDKMIHEHGYSTFYEFLIMKDFQRVDFDQIKL